MTAADIVSQGAIGLLGVAAIWLSQQRAFGLRRWACVLGMAAQPAWFYSTYTAAQWGIFVLCFFYTYSWAVGIRNFWVLKSGRQSDIDAKRYRKLQRWMSSNVREGWSEVEQLGAQAAWLGWDAMDESLDSLPECDVGLCNRGAK